AGREANHADLLRVDPQFLSPAPHQAHRTLRVLERPQRRHALDVAGPAWAAVLEDDPGDPDRVQPGRDLFALNVPAEIVVTAAGTDQHGDAGVLVLRRWEHRQRRLADVGDPVGRLAADFVRFAADLELEDLLRARNAHVAGRLAGPELEHAWRIRRPTRA